MMRVYLVVGMMLMAGCHSVPNPFVSMTPDYSQLPAETVEAIATEIETAVATGNREFTLTDREGFKVTDERIVQAVRTRIARSELIQEFLDSGHLWERGNGLVAILRTAEYKKERTRREKDRDALLVVSENQDRWALYEGMVKANNLSPRALSGIQATFHKTRSALMKDGQAYEDASGQKVVKGA